MKINKSRKNEGIFLVWLKSHQCEMKAEKLLEKVLKRLLDFKIISD